MGLHYMALNVGLEEIMSVLLFFRLKANKVMKKKLLLKSFS